MATSSNIFGLSKLGKPLSASQWMYKIEQESKSNLNKKTYSTPQAYIQYQHLLLFDRIGVDEYKRIFGKMSKRYTLLQDINTRSLFPDTEESSTPSTSTTTTETPATEAPVNAGDKSTPTKKRPAEEPLEADTPSKQAKTTSDTAKSPAKPSDESSAANSNPIISEVAPVEVDVEMAEGGARSGGGGGVADQPLQFFKASGLQHHGSCGFSFHNSFRLRSFGNVLYQNRPTGNVGAARTVTTPMISLPVEWIWFYIPYSTYKWLAETDNMIVTHCKVKVTPIGQMVSFGTNSATSESAAPSHTLYGMSNIGINMIWPTDNVTITRNTSSPMEISATSRQTNPDVWIQRIWGNANQSTREDNIHTAINHEIILPNSYLRFYQLSEEQNTTAEIQAGQNTLSVGQYGMLPLNRYLTKFPLKAHNGLPIVNYEYKFKHPLHSKPRQYVLAQSDFRNTNTALVPGNARLLRTRSRGNYSVFGISRGVNASFPINNSDTTGLNIGLVDFGFLGSSTDNYRNTYLEGAIPTHYDMTPTIRHAQPGVYFGVEAVQANVPEIAASYINASCDWYVETELYFGYVAREIEHPYVPMTATRNLALFREVHRDIAMDEPEHLNASRYNTNAIAGEKLSVNQDPNTTMDTGTEPVLDYDLFGDSSKQKKKKEKLTGNIITTK